MLPTITIAVTTFKRSHSLLRLLTTLQDMKNHNCCLINKILVIDNDGNKSAYQATNSVKGKFNIKYIVEGTRGIANARNAAINAVNSDFLCFIDDDELPSEQWLDELVKKQKETNADCVYGPVYPVMPPTAPAWIKRGRFFDPPPFDENNPAISAGAGNLMISCAFLKKTGLRFDERFNLTGGEDTFFIRQGQKLHGMKIIGAAKAAVTEPVSPERLKLCWLLRRKFRIGNGLALYERFENAPLQLRILRCIKGIARVVAGLAVLSTGVVFGRCMAARGLVMIAFGLGMLTGLMGFVFKEYTYS